MDNNQTAGFEIDLFKLFQALWKKALVIILVALIAAILVLVATLFFTTPTYEATASFYVNNSSFSFGATSFSITSGELMASDTLVNTYVYILKSRTTMEEIISAADLKYNYEQLSNMITTKAVTSTGAFEVTVSSSSPHEAELIANTIAKVLPERIAELVDGSSVRIVDYAIVPAHRASPSYTKNTMVGLLAGAVLAAGIVTLRFVFASQNDDLIHSADEMKKFYPKYHMLAVIPDMGLSEKKGYYYYSSYYESDKDKKEGE